MALSPDCPLSTMSSAELCDLLIEQTPQNRALGMRLLAIDAGRLVMEIPWQANLVGDTRTGALHEGAITTLIDTACGSAVLTQLTEFLRPATLDLRVDYRRASRRDAAVRCVANCESFGDHMALVQARAYDGPADDDEHLIASATGSFAVFRSPAARLARAAMSVRA